MESQENGNIKTAYVVMAAFDFLLISNIRLARMKLGYSQEELSFLFGREKNYVAIIEDPTNKKKYDLNHLNFYGKVLDKLPRKLIPKSKAPGAFIRLNSKSIEYPCKKNYEAFEVLDDGSITPLLSFYENHLPTSYLDQEMAPINEWVKVKFNKGYFDNPKTGFEIYSHARESLKRKFQPGLIMEALAVYTRRKKAPRLVVKKSEEGWIMYKREL